MKNTLICYHYFAHYRKGVIDELRNSKNSNYVFAADYDGDSSVKTVNKEQLPKGNLLELKNVWVGPFLWQRGLLKQIFTGSDISCSILLGDYRFISSWVYLVLAKIMRKKVYLWTHGLLSEGQGIKWFVRKRMYKLATGLLLYGDNAVPLLKKGGITADRCHVIYNSLTELSSSNEELKQKKLLFQQRGFKYDFIFSSRVLKSRKLDLLIEAIKQLKAKGELAKVLIVGDGEYLCEFKKNVKLNGLEEQFFIVGAIYDNEILDAYFAQSKCLIMPSAIGLSALHSILNYTPVLTNDNFTEHKPEVECLKKGLSGYFYSNDSLPSLVENMEMIMKSELYTKTFFESIEVEINFKYSPSAQVRLIEEFIK